MVYNRFKGFKDVYYLLLSLALIAVFWSYLGLAMVLFHPNDPYETGHYLLYQISAIAGLAIASLRTSKADEKISRCDLAGCHKIAFRNVAYVGGAILLLLVLLKDPTISRIFLFSFLPFLYLVFLVTHRFLP